MNPKERSIFIKSLIVTFLAITAIDFVVESAISYFNEGNIIYSLTMTKIVARLLISTFVAYLAVRRYRKKEMGY